MTTSAVPLFVVGVGRSGTTLLQSMLASHPAIVSMPETGFLRRRILSSGLRTGERSVRQIRCGDKRLARIPEEIYGKVSEESETCSPLTFYRRVRDAYGDARYLLDKDPRLLEHLPGLFALFPEALVIHILRDPRDVLLSKQGAAWSGSRPWWVNLAAGRMQLDIADRGLSQEQRWRVHTLRYEDLLKRPEETLATLCIQLDLDFDRSMLSFSGAGRALTSSDEGSWKQNVSGPLLTSNQDKWIQKMPAFRQGVCDMVMDEWLSRGGYRRASVQNGVSSAAMLAAGIGIRLLVVLTRWRARLRNVLNKITLRRRA